MSAVVRLAAGVELLGAVTLGWCLGFLERFDWLLALSLASWPKSPLESLLELPTGSRCEPWSESSESSLADSPTVVLPLV